MKSISIAVGLPLLFAASALAQGTGAEARLREKHIVLPLAPVPVGIYVEAVKTGNLLFVSGTGGDEKWRGRGKVGRDISADDAREAAHSAGLRMLAAVRQELGSLDKVKRVVKILGLVNAAPGFI